VGRRWDGGEGEIVVGGNERVSGRGGEREAKAKDTRGGREGKR